MDMQKLTELSENISRQRAIVEAMGAQQTPVEHDKKIKADARYRLAWDAYMAAEREYRDAIAGMKADQLAAIAR